MEQSVFVVQAESDETPRVNGRQLPGEAGGLEFVALTQGGFGFLEWLVNNRAQHEPLIRRAERVRGEMHAALGELSAARPLLAAGDKLAGILRRQPDRECP